MFSCNSIEDSGSVIPRWHLSSMRNFFHRFFFSSQFIAKQLLSVISQIYPEFTMQSLLLAIGKDLFSRFWPSFQKAECQIITVYLVFCCQKIWSSIKILFRDSKSQRK